MKCGEVNMPVEAPAARTSASRCATVEPLPLVPPTVMTGHAGRSNPSTRATAATRARPMSMVFGCTDSCRASHSASVRTRSVCLSRRCLPAGGASGGGGACGLLQQQAQHRHNAIAHVAPVDDHVERAVLEEE